MLINPKTTHPHIYFFAFGQMLINPNYPHTHFGFFVFGRCSSTKIYQHTHGFCFWQMHITPKTIAKNTAKHLQIPILLHRYKPHTTNCGLNANMSN
jgi:hypothetical protein